VRPRYRERVNRESSEKIDAHQIAIIAETRCRVELVPFSAHRHVIGKENLARRLSSDDSL